MKTGEFGAGEVLSADESAELMAILERATAAYGSKAEASRAIFGATNRIGIITGGHRKLTPWSASLIRDWAAEHPAMVAGLPAPVAAPAVAPAVAAPPTLRSLGGDVEAVNEWVQRAQPGARIIYGRGVYAVTAAPPGVAGRLRAMCEAGLVILHVKHARSSLEDPCDYIAVRRAKPVPKGFPKMLFPAATRVTSVAGQ